MNKKITITIILLIISYGLWNGRNLILGPRIHINSPKNNESFDKNIVTIEGKAQNVAFLSLNGNQIYIDKDNNFSEKILLVPGYSTLEIRGRDKFGKEKVEVLKLYNTAKPPSPTDNVAVTPQSNT